jgi:hypothetical protein
LASALRGDWALKFEWSQWWDWLLNQQVLCTDNSWFNFEIEQNHPNQFMLALARLVFIYFGVRSR